MEFKDTAPASESPYVCIYIIDLKVSILSYTPPKGKKNPHATARATEPQTLVAGAKHLQHYRIKPQGHVHA